MKSPLLAAFLPELFRRRLERRDLARRLTDRGKQFYQPRGAGVCGKLPGISRERLHSRLPGDYRRDSACPDGPAAYEFHVRLARTTTS